MSHKEVIVLLSKYASNLKNFDGSGYKNLNDLLPVLIVHQICLIRVFVFSGPRPGPKFVFTGPGPQFVFTSPGRKFVFTGPGPKFVFTGPGPQCVLIDPGQK